jgi:hypothetical protein
VNLASRNSGNCRNEAVLLRDGRGVCALGPWKAVCETVEVLLSADQKPPVEMEVHRVENNAKSALARLGCGCGLMRC